MKLFLFIYILWLMHVVVGVARPQTYLGLLKWKMRFWGRLCGFSVHFQSDDVVCKKLRQWYIFLLIAGILILYVLINRY